LQYNVFKDLSSIDGGKNYRKPEELQNVPSIDRSVSYFYYFVIDDRRARAVLQVIGAIKFVDPNETMIMYDEEMITIATFIDRST
jgi:hypothetical protein